MYDSEVDQLLKQKDLNILRSVVRENERFVKDVANKIRCSCFKWWEAGFV